MEERKVKEMEHYDKLAREWRIAANSAGQIANGDIEMKEVMKMTSYRYLYELLKKYAPGKRVLDYGCGHGMHTAEIAKMGAREVVGIDLSEESLKLAKQRLLITNNQQLKEKIKFIKMDAEDMKFPENSFDIVFDGGAFSSIDINKAFSEIARVLKPGGLLIGIETLGHHPLANLKRWLNKARGVRTGWAASHIMKMKDFNSAEKFFDIVKVDYFHLTSLVAIPFQNLPAGDLLVRTGENLDKLIFTTMPFLKRYAFKAVFVFKKND